MILGITFEEKVLENISLEEYIELINTYDISLLEFAPDFINYDIDFYKKVFEGIKDNSFQINFHLPSFADEKLMTDNFNETKDEYIIDYFKKLNQVFDLTRNAGTVVFHGAKYEDIPKSKAMNQTLLFINFLIELFLKNNYNLSLAIETLNNNKYKIIGDSRKDLNHILQIIDSPKLKICWDITHDFLNYREILYPKGKILENINHCHIHGFKDQETHLSINKSPDLIPAVKFAKKNNIPINIELLMQDNYLDILRSDIVTLQSII